MVKNLPAMREKQVQSLGREVPLEKEMATHSSSLAWRSSWTEEPGSYSPWSCKELDTTKQLTHTLEVALVLKNPFANAGDLRDVGLILGSGRSPGGGHGNPLHILAWRSPWTEKPTVHRVVELEVT